MKDDLLDVIKNAEELHYMEKKDMVSLFRESKYDEALFRAADRVRKKYVGDKVHLRGLIEFSNICKRNCMYCGLRHSNKSIERYRIPPDKIIELAKKAVGYGYRTVVMQSGEDDYYTVDMMKYIISNIKKMDIAITLSIGEKTFEEYEAYKEAGADRYLIRIETTDPELYENMDPGMSHENRKRCLDDLKKLGYEVGTGCLIGLPGQSLESLTDDILFFKDIDADMVGVGPFIPNADTPLKEAEGGSFKLALKVVAMTRLLMPDINIPATTAMETLNPNGRTIALNSGSNVVMPNVTEGIYRKLYALYPGKICTGDTPAHCVNCITGKIVMIGREVASDKGFRVKSI
ncbi:[FeFe] hydrogenase H-cluster radical SAM maturase HydE [Clostridium tyrobutyricum]|jgi:biotin synthase|uniref:[FeFe] hydrogenase H-cluster radical SAM maturase HydE n=1 Tax=Clostridium tyrobutyricum TaxID=1519 RepID=UPI0005802D90|nr:[FeFe] hydrogenase H-cluster radical SAM maturase HydE [Clostridium tyrobutyricum]MBV4414710.1 [FeFe] hydrogenase H-cluster radical SAM maturase HydE [Clostridium tyrobutyricum]MBV4423131.1 [FeFe] hydrogenase H-cluster radical SAM maturase HydE [Clostridium tyrobutyricum]MBV4431106.1 [FeFe] hydrogenase H-cluster radical SAM maturase HydE [Clostridium tyrobutyricum]MBV4436256.1 [FeFe] hydrogenase H-cluster radical SAM maturase HydE [Clostridium tyrobutyricum]MBV4445956.1 [FeFe] hydrogenase H